MRRTGLRVHELETQLQASAAASDLPIEIELNAESLRGLGNGGFVSGQPGAVERTNRREMGTVQEFRDEQRCQ